uniref:20 kDa chaperonin, chloroplastic n=1 Tax=Helicotheca tamesis TaxID=374047 RepID=A0A7S2HBS0_9STRA|mmetsp:Transcript_16863/g.23109  ORF Transcript_16863/g.23109 Transcript_16863/m.23109 type:complete len:269 (+) Transcript_16863:164-970(+)|eukprot:CAMPEP_0185737248 /NCGR_PEP_ID=MMETSP1171-20130828/29973_1 /TAXON_ID=374046 /ORGANISM="Helicotheca tamensis, Strain CCMP826" /LENGTH=268 /DNA_ID=CAMNT_0028408123 /DNA_START=120 /DNA_END=926 /DNA_ORIENTATION=+
MKETVASLLLFLVTVSSSANAFVTQSGHQQTTFLQSKVMASSSRLYESLVLDGKSIDKAIEPTNNMLLVKTVEVQDTTSGGIVLTGRQKIERKEGAVVAVGPGRHNGETGVHFPLPFSVGDNVLYQDYTGTELDYNGAKHLLLSDNDILVKFDSGDPTDSIENAQVLYDGVLVKIQKSDVEQSASGILISRTVAKKGGGPKSSVGEVVKVGPGRKAFNGVLMEMDVSVGDFIKFRDFASNVVQLSVKEAEEENVEFAVVRMTDILAKF